MIITVTKQRDTPRLRKASIAASLLISMPRLLSGRGPMTPTVSEKGVRLNLVAAPAPPLAAARESVPVFLLAL